MCPEGWEGAPYDAAHEDTACFLAGHCFCDGEGKKLRKLRTQLMDYHKLTTMKEPPEQSLMDQRFLVWRLRCAPLESLFEGMAMVWGSGDPEEVDEDT